MVSFPYRNRKYVRSARAIILDWKNLDYAFLNGYPNCYAFQQMQTGLEQAYQILAECQQTHTPLEYPLFIVIEELSAFLSMQEKREADRIKMQIGAILSLGRAFNIRAILSQQRFDSSWLSAGARDQVSCWAVLGHASKEALPMYGLKSEKVEEYPAREQGAGYWIQDGDSDLAIPIQVPRVHNPRGLDMAIRHLVE